MEIFSTVEIWTTELFLRFCFSEKSYWNVACIPGLVSSTIIRMIRSLRKTQTQKTWVQYGSISKYLRNMTVAVDWQKDKTTLFKSVQYAGVFWLFVSAPVLCLIWKKSTHSANWWRVVGTGSNSKPVSRLVLTIHALLQTILQCFSHLERISLNSWGYIGVLTGVKKGAFSISLDQRDEGSPHFLKWYEIFIL